MGKKFASVCYGKRSVELERKVWVINYQDVFSHVAVALRYLNATTCAHPLIHLVPALAPPARPPSCCSDKLQSDTLSALVKRRRRRGRRGESDKKVPARIAMECHVPRQSFPQSPKTFANATNYDYCLAILLSLSLLFIFPQNNFHASVGGFSFSWGTK